MTRLPSIFLGVAAFFICVAAALLGLVASATPVPKDAAKPEPEPYFATTVGTTWEYQGGKDVLVDVVTEVEKRGGTLQVTVGRAVDGKVANHRVYEVSRDSLHWVEASTGPLDPPLLLLRLPAKAGDKWDVDSKKNGVKFTGSVTVMGNEKLVVPAGTFETVRVEFAFVEGTDPEMKTTYWYAQNVGIVKRSTKGGGEVVLKKFTSGDSR